jgi:hypothetical protein
MEFIYETDLPLLNKKLLGRPVAIPVMDARYRVAYRLNIDFGVFYTPSKGFLASYALDTIAWANCTRNGHTFLEFCSDASFRLRENEGGAVREVTMEDARFLLSVANPYLNDVSAGFAHVCAALDWRSSLGPS